MSKKALTLLKKLLILTAVICSCYFSLVRFIVAIFSDNIYSQNVWISCCIQLSGFALLFFLSHWVHACSSCNANRPEHEFTVHYDSLTKLSSGGVFFVQESFVLQHASAIFEWVFCVIIMLFYGTFAFEFAGISSDTMMVLARGQSLQSVSRDHKMESLAGASQHQPESLSIL